MSEFFSNLVSFIVGIAESAVRLYIPIIFSFRFLRLRDVEGQQRIIKYWCLYSILFLVDWVLAPLIYQTVYPILIIGLFAALNYNKYQLTETIYDNLIPPLFDRYRSNIEALAGQVDQVFKQKTQKLQKGVKQSFESKAKKMMGNILVQVMNPNAGQQKQE